ncbi:MAG: hypothetical protein M0P39_02925 [Rhodocyclaceae bacterium]|jgi:hypothetical protein|nr:hypothetical protein [Rhodocyclaceae bacterium]
MSHLLINELNFKNSLKMHPGMGSTCCELAANGMWGRLAVAAVIDFKWNGFGTKAAV